MREGFSQSSHRSLSDVARLCGCSWLDMDRRVRWGSVVAKSMLIQKGGADGEMDHGSGPFALPKTPLCRPFSDLVLLPPFVVIIRALILCVGGNLFMARLGIVFGLLLCGLTVVALLGMTSKAPSQFIPMMVGIPILFCGVVGLNPHRRKHSMHGAASVAVLGLLVGSGLSIYCGANLPGERDIFRVATVLAALCLIFVVVCVVSFVHARRKPDSTVRTKIAARAVAKASE